MGADVDGSWPSIFIDLANRCSDAGTSWEERSQAALVHAAGSAVTCMHLLSCALLSSRSALYRFRVDLQTRTVQLHASRIIPAWA